VFSTTPRIRQAVTPIALAILSLIAAVSLWVAVTESENPTRDEQLPFTIPVEPVGVPDGLAVYSLSPDAVVVTVRATDETLEDLTASNFRATVTMTGIRDTQSTQSIVVETVGVDEEDASIVEVSSQFTRVVLETEVTKTVPVQVNRLGSLAQGFTLAATEVNPEQVTVIGPASSVGLVVSAIVEVNLTGVRSDIELQYELTARDAGGAVQPRVRVEPTSAEVRINVEQLETPQVVPVLVDTQGEVARGYNVVDINPEPWSVLVTGSLETLQSLDFLSTEPIDISGATATVERSVALQIPDGIEADREAVTVTIEIVAAPGERAITVAPVVINVPDGLTAVLQTTSLTVRVAGPTPVLNELTPANFQATVDAEGLAEGVHTLDVDLTVPQGITLTGIEPVQAVIALRP
jgi:YbbR domain-containing protein